MKRTTILRSTVAVLLLLLGQTASLASEAAPPAQQPAATSQTTTLQLLQRLLEGCVLLGGSEVLHPTPGIHRLTMNAAWSNKFYQAATDFDLVRGTGERFYFKGVVPELGAITTGCGAYPWLVDSNNILLCGTLEPGSMTSFTAFITPESRNRYQSAIGLIAAASMMPAAIQGYANVTELPPRAGERRVQLQLAYGPFRGPLGLSSTPLDSVAPLADQRHLRPATISPLGASYQAACDYLEHPRQTRRELPAPRCCVDKLSWRRNCCGWSTANKNSPG